MRVPPPPFRLVPAALSVLALAGCGGSASHSGTAPSGTVVTGPGKARPSARAGAGSLADAPDICRPFVFHLDATFARPIAASDGGAVFAELQGLSNRLSFLSAPASQRAELARLAGALGQAADSAQRLERARTPAAGAPIVAELRGRLQAADASARRLGLAGCVISLPKAAG